jgi:hypothetical protein
VTNFRSRWGTVALASMLVASGSFLLWLVPRLFHNNLETNDQTSSVVSMALSLVGLVFTGRSHIRQRQTEESFEKRLKSFARDLGSLRTNAGEPPITVIRAEFKRLRPDRPDLQKSVGIVLRGEHCPSIHFVDTFIDACFAIASGHGIQIPAPYSDRQWWPRRYAELRDPRLASQRFRATAAGAGALALLAVGIVAIAYGPAQKGFSHAIRIEQVTVPSLSSYHRVRAVLRNDSDREELATKLTLALHFGNPWLSAPFDKTYRIRGQMTVTGNGSGGYEILGKVDEDLTGSEFSVPAPMSALALTESLRGTLRLVGPGRFDLKLGFDSTIRLPARQLVVVSLDVPEKMQVGMTQIRVRALTDLSMTVELTNPSALVKSCNSVRSTGADSLMSVSPHRCR